MTMQARIETMASRVQEELDATNARVGNLALLSTPRKDSLVSALNDLHAMRQSAGVAISADAGNALSTGTDGGLYCPAVVSSTIHW